MTTWESKRSCASCHHQHLPLTLLRTARQRGVAFDVAAAPADGLAPGRPGGEPGLRRPGRHADRPDARLGLVAELARRHRRQAHAGHAGLRPPDPEPPVTRRALEHHRRPAAAVLQRRHGDGGRGARHPAATCRRRWTPSGARQPIAPVCGCRRSCRRTPKSARCSCWDCRGPGPRRHALAPHVRALVAAQRADGGWAQLPRLGSDAYATGQALVALQRAGGLDASHPSVRRGLAYLLSQQREDGSWLVETRLHEQDLVSPPYFETGFPHGPHQIISAMGTTWAAMALLESLPVRAARRRRCSTAFRRHLGRAAVDAARRCSAPPQELGRLLDQGLDANSRTPKGTTVLMMAAHDADKVTLLLARGADVVGAVRCAAQRLDGGGQLSRARSTRCGCCSTRAPRRRSRRRQPDRSSIISPMLYAIWSGETAKVALLLERGAKLPRRVSLLGGDVPGVAARAGDLPAGPADGQAADRPRSRRQRAHRSWACRP